jgi:hypothetical protein
MIFFFSNLICVCTCVTLLQAASCITTDLAYVYELVSVHPQYSVCFVLLTCCSQVQLVLMLV